MIKIDKENLKIETDCRTVGEFMTEAAAFGCDRLVIKVDGCRYEFFDNPKIRVTDDTPIGLVFIDHIGSGGITPDEVYISVLSKPKPKTVRKSGWINIFKLGERRVLNGFYKSREEAASFIGLEKDIHVATVKVEWDEYSL